MGWDCTRPRQPVQGQVSHEGYNFCWAVRTLRVKHDESHWQGRSPAMAAGLSDHLWTWREWFTRPAAQSA